MNTNFLHPIPRRYRPTGVRVNTYIPRDLHTRAKAANVNVSRILVAALHTVLDGEEFCP